jgi:hypothetical protein
MSRYVNLKLTEKQAAEVRNALECEISSRQSSAYDDLGDRCDVPRGQGAIDDCVPTLGKVVAKLRDLEEK